MSAPVRTVAVFDSSPDALQMLRRTLEHRKVRVICESAEDVRRGRIDFLALMSDHDPDVVVWDIAPPYEENWKFFTWLRTSKPGRARAFVVTTTHKTRVHRAAGLDSNGIEIISKPYDGDLIAAAISRATPPGVSGPGERRPRPEGPAVFAETIGREHAAPMADPELALYCPNCGERLRFMRTKRHTHFYQCSRHGYLILPPDGRVRVASREEDYEP